MNRHNFCYNMTIGTLSCIDILRVGQLDWYACTIAYWKWNINICSLVWRLIVTITSINFHQENVNLLYPMVVKNTSGNFFKISDLRLGNCGSCASLITVHTQMNFSMLKLMACHNSWAHKIYFTLQI